MSENPIQDVEEQSDLKPVAIEGKLPLKSVGIENLREANPKHLPPHRYLHPWFARRPTPASRLAILASVLPEGVDSDEILKWLQIGPKQDVVESISNYVERKKATESERSGTLEDHYGYPRPFTKTPSQNEIEDIHEKVIQHWDGELPTVLDPTAGGGVIPFESLRYGLPTKANELNPVPSVILRILLEYAPKVGSLKPELERWGEKIQQKAKSDMAEFFPSSESGKIPDNYISTYVITCQSCGAEIPLLPKLWLRTRRDRPEGTKVAAKPILDENGHVSYECIKSTNRADFDEMDPDNGPVSRGGDTECLNCGVVTEDDTVRQQFKDDNYRTDVYCVRYRDNNGDTGFRAPTPEDQEALEAARVKIGSDYELSTLLTEPIPEGQKTTEPRNYGLTEWRDLFSSRQLISNYAYLDAINKSKSDIRAEYDRESADAIITLLTLALSKVLDRNCRLADWDTSKGYPSRVFKGKNFAFKRVFVDNNISVGGTNYLSYLDKIVESYEEIVSYLPDECSAGDVSTSDAANLKYNEGEIQAAIVDPPYYSSIMYAELSDFFYVWMKKTLQDIFDEGFDSTLTNKNDEAVANPDRFSHLSGDGKSSRHLANDFYEQKMSDIFSELYRVLEPGGVMTVMFTHKETDAWDTLTMSLINSGFTITSTHPITSEMPQRAGMRESASADSTLLLTGRKPHQERDPENAIPTLWSDVKSDTRAAAKDAARELIDSGLSLTKTDVIISAFGPTLRVFADAYPVVDDEDNEVPPRRALEQAREAVTQVLVDEYLEAEGIGDLDDITEWYVLCWLVHESQTFSYDEGRQLGLGIGVDVDEIKRSTKTWRKSRGDMKLRGHADRVQNVEEKEENRSSRIPVNPDDLSFGLALDKVHAAMHIYDVKGESACCDWLRERNFGSDSTFKATLQALLQVLPHDHEDWELARDLAVGRTRDVLDLDFSPNVFAENSEQTQQTGIDDY
jgi:adenine-specific DNA methylase